MQHTFLDISLPLLLHNYNVELSSYTFYGRNVACSNKILLVVFLFASSFFTVTHYYFTPANISHFLTTALKFSCFVANEVRLLWFFWVFLFLFFCFIFFLVLFFCFIFFLVLFFCFVFFFLSLALALSLCAMSTYGKKNLVEKEAFFSLPLSPWISPPPPLSLSLSLSLLKSGWPRGP